MAGNDHSPPLETSTRHAENAGVLRARRSPRLIAAGVLCATLGGLGAAFAWNQTTTSQTVVVMTQDVARGETVRAEDLGVVTMGSVPGLRTIPADQAQSLIGKEALVDLPAGSLVGEGSIGTSAPAKGTSEVGLKLAAGRLPVRDIPAGTKVQLVAVPAKGANVGSEGATSQEPEAPAVFDAVVVTAPRQLPDGASWVLDVRVADADAAPIAQLASAEQLVLVKKAGG